MNWGNYCNVSRTWNSISRIQFHWGGKVFTRTSYHQRSWSFVISVIRLRGLRSAFTTTSHTSWSSLFLKFQPYLIIGAFLFRHPRPYASSVHTGTIVLFAHIWSRWCLIFLFSIFVLILSCTLTLHIHQNILAVFLSNLLKSSAFRAHVYRSSLQF